MITYEDCEHAVNRMAREVPDMGSSLDWAQRSGWDADSLIDLVAEITGSCAVQLGLPADPTLAPDPNQVIAATVMGALLVGFDLASAQRRTDAAMPDINNVLEGKEA